MGEPTCLLRQQPFSYAAGLPDHSNEGNPVHTLGQSVSFGRFMTESLAWEKWSSFSHNRYVEEAERFSRPGSVAQKKAFFEAHYRNLAARKAAALLEQANSAANKVPEPEEDPEFQDSGSLDSELDPDNPEADVAGLENPETENVEEADALTEDRAVIEDSDKVKYCCQVIAADKNEEDKEAELSGAKLMERPLLKDFIHQGEDSAPTSKKKLQVSSSKTMIPGRPLNLLHTPANSTKETIVTPSTKKSAIDLTDGKKSTPSSTHKSMNLTPVREFNRKASAIIREIDNSRVTSNCKASKDCSTPLRTPTTVSKLKEWKHPPATTPKSENRNFRDKTHLHPSTSESKTVRPKWHFLPTDCSKLISACKNKSQSPNLCTPFSFRTEDRAARRKKRLEEKFNANQAEKVQLQATLKEKAETEIKKLRHSLCFKARPLPSFYKERTKTKGQMEKVPLTKPESPDICQKAENASQPPRMSSTKSSSGCKQMGGKKSENSHSLASRFRASSPENACPNIQHKYA